jgi:hypothetical protein
MVDQLSPDPRAAGRGDRSILVHVRLVKRASGHQSEVVLGNLAPRGLRLIIVARIFDDEHRLALRRQRFEPLDAVADAARVVVLADGWRRFLRRMPDESLTVWEWRPFKAAMKRGAIAKSATANHPRESCKSDNAAMRWCNDATTRIRRCGGGAHRPAADDGARRPPPSIVSRLRWKATIRSSSRGRRGLVRRPAWRAGSSPA